MEFPHFEVAETIQTTLTLRLDSNVPINPLHGFLEQTYCAQSSYITRILWDVETDLHMALCAEIIDFVRGDVSKKVDQRTGIGEVP